MKILDILNSESLRFIREQVYSFTEKILRDYIENVKQILEEDKLYYDDKDIHDAVWGTIKLKAGEIIIIDSPLIQRLRRINHLGLAGLLFPGADYSRFEHTLGVLYVADKISTELSSDKNLVQYHEECKFRPIQLCRLAAIFHDAGHLFYSHASEKYYQSIHYSDYEIIKKIRKYFVTEIGVVEPKLSEIISVFIVISPAVLELIEISWDKLGSDVGHIGSVSEISGEIASLILGVATNKKTLPYARIISGPIDADKCDYLARDSSHTGVPVAVDLYRVIQKLQLIKEVPENLGNVWDDEDCPDKNELNTLCIAYSAAKTVEEILISRSLMHDKIYYHHKIRTAEEMFRQIMLLLDKSGYLCVSRLEYALYLIDHDIISNYPEMFLMSVADKFGVEYTDNTYFQQACELIKMLINRNLFKRTCIISKSLISESGAFVINSGALINDLFIQIIKTEYDKFFGSVRAEIEQIMQLLDKKSEYQQEIDYIVLPVIFKRDGSGEDYNIPVECNGHIMRARELFQSGIWEHIRNIKRDAICYLVCNPCIRKEIFLAIEKVFYINYGFYIQHESYEIAKLNKNNLLKLKTDLVTKGYYSKTPQLIHDGMFKKYDQRIIKLLNRFKNYDGPFDPTFQEKPLKTKSQIIGFLKQFVTYSKNPEEIIDGVLQVLNEIKIVDRDHIVENLKELLSRLMKLYKIVPWDMNFTTIGSLLDSSAHMIYYFSDLKDVSDFKNEMGLSLSFNVQSIEKILNADYNDNPIIFIDDAFFSGKQTLAIFQEMCGVPIEKRIIQESHNVKLSSVQLKKLKKAKICLCYFYANKDNIEFLKNKLGELKLNIEILYVQEFPEPLFIKKDIIPFKNQDIKNQIEQIFTKIGIELLEYNKIDKDGNFKKRWDKNKIDNFALGYNNAQQLLVFAWNTPTYTLTPFWLGGILKNGVEWRPLFPRQSKS